MHRLTGLLLACTLAAAVLAVVPPAPAAGQGVVTVTTLADPPPDGSCGAGGECSLREAVLLANASADRGTTIMLGAGTHVLTQGAAGNADAASGDLDVTKALAVLGPAGGGAIIDVVVADRAFDVSGGSEFLALQDVVVTGGGQVDLGGAIRTVGSPLELTRVALRTNLAEIGGAISASGQATVSLTDTVIERNAALTGGGGIYLADAGTVMAVVGGAVRDNTASGLGGGIWAQTDVSMSISGTEVAGNEADLGAGVAILGGAGVVLTLTDARFVENVARAGGSGGGVFALGVALDASGLVVDGNSAPGVGGGMLLESVTGSLVDSHIVGNEAGDQGGGLSLGGDATPLRVERTLVERNTAGEGGGIYAAGALALVTSTISGNAAASTGGLQAEAPVAITASTLAMNRSTAGTAGNLGIAAAVTVDGALLAQAGGTDQADDVDCVVSGAGSLTGSGSVSEDLSCPLGSGNSTGIDAAVGPLVQAGGPWPTHGLAPGSIAVDVGGTTCPATDARGTTRPLDGDLDGTALCDAGAVESVPAADLAVTLADGPDPVPTGEALVYTVTVFNAGPQDAAAARLEIALPADLAEVVATTDLGACTVAGAAVSCELGTVAATAAATVRVSGRPQTPGLVQATATASSRAADPTPEDATATATTTVGGGGGSGEVIPTAIAISQARFADPAQRPPSGVVLSRDDLFADSLGGAVLTAEAPLLFTASAALDPRTAAEIDRLLGGTGTVTLLGGDPALSPAVADAVTAAGYTVQRLAGPSRVETAIAIARAVAPQGPQTVALARADAPADNPTAAWADAVTAGAWSADSGAPVLLTQTASMHPAVAAYLSEAAPARRVLLGGEPALSLAVADATGPHERVQGPNRYGTAAAIATQLWPQPTAGHLLTSGDHPDGWAYALAAAGLAADGSRPVLLVETLRLPAETRALTCTVGAPSLSVIGGEEVVSTGVRDALAMPC